MTYVARIAIAKDDDGLHQPSPPPALPMPDQDLSAPFKDPAAPGTNPAMAMQVLRRVTLTAPLLVTLAFGWIAMGWFALDGKLTALECLLIMVTTFAGYWLTLSLCTSILGLFWRAPIYAQTPVQLSVAILCPMYAEPADVTITNALNLLVGLSQQQRHKFSLHILSDTRDPAAAAVEQTVVLAAQSAFPQLRILYRRRPVNTDFKSGNIREWVMAQGSAFDAMLILDADSVMTVQTVLRMTDTLAGQPQLGLVQSTPRVLPGETLWQRTQSFAAEVYGTNLARGFAMWTGDEGLFLGHNAVVRTRAFATCAGLPHLQGRAPKGGVILSHDFVEAALLRRAGWGVKMMPDLTGSFEDTPETLPGYLRRDMRWCQGNMQHLRLLATPGLHLVSRFHLFQGAMAYFASVWWLGLLGVWILSDMSLGISLMPVWHDLPPISQTALGLSVAVTLLGPKLLGIAAHLWERQPTLQQTAGFAASVLAEMSLSMLIAPTLMVHQVRAVVRTFAGCDAGWMPHQCQRPNLRSLARFHATETLLGGAMLAVAVWGNLSPWLMAIAISLFSAIPLSLLMQQNIGRSWFLRPLTERLSTHSDASPWSILDRKGFKPLPKWPSVTLPAQQPRPDQRRDDCNPSDGQPVPRHIKQRAVFGAMHRID